MVVMLDEILSKGNGMGNGITLFMAINICGSFFDAGLSTNHINVGEGKDNFEYEGAIFALLHNILSKKDKINGLISAISRTNGPNVYSVLAGIGLIFVAIYVHQYRFQFNLSSRKMRGFKQPYPIKLIYASNICLIVYAMIVSNLYIIS